MTRTLNTSGDPGAARDHFSRTTVARLVAEGESSLRRSEVETARLDSQVLLAHALGEERSYVLAHMKDALAEEAASSFLSLIERRSRKEPLAYIIGEKEFYSLNFTVTPAVLIPRPDTETIIDTAIKLYGKASTLDFLDVGTGSGAIAVALAKNFPRWRGVAVDTSDDALDIAARNINDHGLEDRITLKRSDIFSGLAEERFGLIVSNPPYIPEGSADVAFDVDKFEPHEALYAGPDGMDVIRTILEQAPSRLASGGRLIMEIGHDQSGEVERLTREAGFGGVEFFHDLSGTKRVIVAKASTDG